MRATVLGRDGEFFLLRFDASEPLEKLLLRLGRMPLPPYIERDADAATRSATRPSTRASPARSRRRRPACISTRRCSMRCAQRGVEFGYVTLHVGAGTFQPMRSERIEDHVMHREWLNVGAELVEKIRHTRAARRARHRGRHDGRARAGNRDCAMATLAPFAGETQIFIFPGYRIRASMR